MRFLVLLLLGFLFSTIACAQSAAETLSDKIATKMKDSLHLTQSQREQVFKINMKIADEKAALRKQYSGEELRVLTQKVEGTRDALYRDVLPPGKYIIYLQKKRNLVNNN